MNSVLLLQVVIERLVVVDISPLNPHVELDPTDKSEWNMEHYFHSMKAVHFDQSLSMSKVAYLYYRYQRISDRRDNTRHRF